jgi:hypothetical protein
MDKLVAQGNVSDTGSISDTRKLRKLLLAITIPAIESCDRCSRLELSCVFPEDSKAMLSMQRRTATLRWKRERRRLSASPGRDTACLGSDG